MKKETPKRIAIIGLPGSGKSTFATKLGEHLNIPVHHLDKHVFVAGGKKRDTQESLAIQKKLVDKESWIIEGCSMSTLEMRFARADTVIHLHFPRLLCIWRLFKRFFNFDKALSNTGCARIVNWRLLKYTWDFDKDKSERIEQLKTEYPHLDFRVFCNSLDANSFLEKGAARKGPCLH